MRYKHFMTRLDLAVLLGVIFSLFLANTAVFGQECSAVRADVVRLHIMANSDSQADQALKLKVRDRILSEVGELFAAPHSQADAKKAAERLLPDIRRIAQEELSRNGSHASVKAELCNMYFSTRRYDDIVLPAGNYDAVRITLGDGAGQNWWCVMYPPMCVSVAMAEGMDEMAEIEKLNGAPMFRPKLAVVELFEQLTT